MHPNNCNLVYLLGHLVSLLQNSLVVVSTNIYWLIDFSYIVFIRFFYCCTTIELALFIYLSLRGLRKDNDEFHMNIVKKTLRFFFGIARNIFIKLH